MSLSIKELFSEIGFNQAIEIRDKLYSDFQKNKLNPSADFDDNSNAAAYLFFEKLRAASCEPSKLAITPESLQLARERQVNTEFLLGLCEFNASPKVRHSDTQIAIKTPESPTKVANLSCQLNELVGNS